MTGHITAPRVFICGDDSEAVVWAKQWIDGHDIELWSGERFVIRLDHRENDETGGFAVGRSKDAGKKMS
jgi:hypothetical protein